MVGAPQPRGPRVVGNYVLLDVIGRGAMGVVARGKHATTGRVAAIKLLHRLESLERFQREGELTASLNHPGVVRVHEAGVAEGVPYLVYELVEGGRHLGNVEVTSLEEVVGWVAEAAEAVEHAHQRGAVHRDLKPENLLLTPEGRVKVADFGVARILTDSGRLTQTGQMVGTPAYMAPEQLLGERDVDHQADVWALGVVLYELLTGELPYLDDHLVALIGAVSHGPPPAPSTIAPEVPEALDRVCLRALQPKRGARYGSAQEFADALRAALEDPSGVSPRSRRRAAWIAASLAACGAFGLWVGGSSSEAPPTQTTEEPAMEVVEVAEDASAWAGGRARRAAWAGDREAFEAALRELPAAQAEALRWSLEPEGWGTHPPEAPVWGASAGWEALTLAEVALVRGTPCVATAILEEVEAEEDARLALEVGFARVRAAVARGALEEAASALEGVAPEEAFDRSRQVGWGALLEVAGAPTGGWLDRAREEESLRARWAVACDRLRLGQALAPASERGLGSGRAEGRVWEEESFAVWEREAMRSGRDGSEGRCGAWAIGLAEAAEGSNSWVGAEAALEALRVAARLRPCSPALGVARAQALLVLRDAEGALEAAEEAGRWSPGDPWVEHWVARAASGCVEGARLDMEVAELTSQTVVAHEAWREVWAPVEARFARAAEGLSLEHAEGATVRLWAAQASLEGAWFEEDGGRRARAGAWAREVLGEVELSEVVEAQRRLVTGGVEVERALGRACAALEGPGWEERAQALRLWAMSGDAGAQVAGEAYVGWLGDLPARVAWTLARRVPRSAEVLLRHALDVQPGSVPVRLLQALEGDAVGLGWLGGETMAEVAREWPDAMPWILQRLGASFGLSDDADPLLRAWAALQRRSSPDALAALWGLGAPQGGAEAVTAALLWGWVEAEVGGGGARRAWAQAEACAPEALITEGYRLSDPEVDVDAQLDRLLARGVLEGFESFVAWGRERSARRVAEALRGLREYVAQLDLEGGAEGVAFGLGLADLLAQERMFPRFELALRCRALQLRAQLSDARAVEDRVEELVRRLPAEAEVLSRWARAWCAGSSEGGEVRDWLRLQHASRPAGGRLLPSAEVVVAEESWGWLLGRAVARPPGWPSERWLAYVQGARRRWAWQEARLEMTREREGVRPFDRFSKLGYSMGSLGDEEGQRRAGHRFSWGDEWEPMGRALERASVSRMSALSGRYLVREVLGRVQGEMASTTGESQVRLWVWVDGWVEEMERVLPRRFVGARRVLWLLKVEAALHAAFHVDRARRTEGLRSEWLEESKGVDGYFEAKASLAWTRFKLEVVSASAPAEVDLGPLRSALDAVSGELREKALGWIEHDVWTPWLEAEHPGFAALRIELVGGDE